MAVAEKQLEEVSIVKEVRVDFWHTTVGILIKRIVFGVVANAGLVLYNGVMANAIDWSQVRYSALTTMLYIVISTAQTYSDPKIPNTKNTLVVS